MELEGNVVKRYEKVIKGQKVIIEIRDSAYINRSEKELEQIRTEARRIACGIIDRAARAGLEV